MCYDDGQHHVHLLDDGNLKKQVLVELNIFEELKRLFFFVSKQPLKSLNRSLQGPRKLFRYSGTHLVCL